MDRRSVLLAALSTVVSLALCEAGLRSFTRAGSAPAVTAPPDSSDLRLATAYVGKLAAAHGTDRAWFLEDPPPLSNRGEASPAGVARFREFARRGIYAAQAQYIWNRRFVEKEGCASGAAFGRFPRGIPVFDPPGDTPYPAYRFPPSATLPSGLVTNRWGLRGPEIELAKPARTVRIAFLGASTTVHVHSHPFSYPERVGHWLNRFAAATDLELSFETLNAGREGITSSDIAAILRDELLPLDPDVVVYYEGSNQFLKVAPRMAAPRIPGRGMVYNLAAWLRDHTATGALVSSTGLFTSGTSEPRKPWHHLEWPSGVKKHDPDVESRELPLLLPVIVRDLDTIREALRPGGGSLVLCSFVWLAGEGLQISAGAHPHIWQQLNDALWPLRYAEIGELAAFQNLVFRRYAEKRGIDFIDVAGALPQDPRLFSDAIHLLETGERLKAWVVFQQLAPLLRREIARGRLPRRAPSGSLPAPPVTAWSTIELPCRHL